MKKASKWLSLFLACALVLSACGGSKTPGSSESASGSAESASVSGEASAESKEMQKATDENTFVVGAPEMNGDYINGFTNGTYDTWVRRLMGLYGGDLALGTYVSDESGAAIVNKTVVDGDPVRTENADGSLTYTFKIKSGMKWSDGEPITAKDYLFGALFVNSPEWKATGATNATSGSELLGFKPYSDGETTTHAGLHLIDENSFSVTISADYVPYYYETTLAALAPTPQHRYTPNLEVVETPEGVKLQPKEGYKISDDDKKMLVDNQQKAVDTAAKAYDDAKAALEGEDAKKYEAVEKALDALDAKAYEAARTAGKLEDGTELEAFTKAYDAHRKQKAEAAKLEEYKTNPDKLDPTRLLLTAGVLDIAYNYRFKPDVVCGPYKFVSFANGMAKVTLNENFPGNKDGKKPTIQNVIVQTVNQQLDVDFVIKGDIDLAQGVTQAEKIEKAKASDAVGSVDYFRNGYGCMQILTHMGATQHKGVRQAIAYALDREAFVQNISGGYGVVVNGAYGLNMWEYQENQEKLQSELTQYTLNPTAGNAALDTTPYKFEKDGTTPWDPKKAEAAFEADQANFDYWRHDENGKPLVVYHEGPQESVEISNLIGAQVPTNCKRMGLKYVFSTTDFATVLTHYYTPDENNATAPTVFNMGTGFGWPNDPYYQYHSSQIGADNQNRVNDPTADKITETNRKLKPTDKEGWSKGFVEFQKWYNDYMPAIPLYGNQYFDIYNKRVQGLETSSMWTWAQDICDITLAK